MNLASCRRLTGGLLCVLFVACGGSDEAPLFGEHADAARGDAAQSSGAAAGRGSGGTTTGAGGSRTDAGGTAGEAATGAGGEGIDSGIRSDASYGIDGAATGGSAGASGGSGGVADGGGAQDASAGSGGAGTVDSGDASSGGGSGGAAGVGGGGTGGVAGNGGVAGGAGDGGAVYCATNSDCSGFEYCSKAAGDCLGFGSCAPRPRVCPLIIAPVCGCEGATYDNSCLAASAGVNVASNGACTKDCPLSPQDACCYDDGDCARGDYCVGELCSNIGTAAPGVCKPLLSFPECWEDSDCGLRGTCVGAQVCACGAFCLIADSPGQCGPMPR